EAAVDVLADMLQRQPLYFALLPDGIAAKDVGRLRARLLGNGAGTREEEQGIARNGHARPFVCESFPGIERNGHGATDEDKGWHKKPEPRHPIATHMPCVPGASDGSAKEQRSGFHPLG